MMVRIILCVLELAKMSVGFVATAAPVLYPFLKNPLLSKKMLDLLFGIEKGTFLRACPSIWVIIKDFVKNPNKDQAFHEFMRNPYIIVIISGLALVVYLWKKPSKDMFLGSLTTFSLCTYIFGFNSFEKDIQYVLIPMMLTPTLYKGFYGALFAISYGVLYPFCCSHKSEEVIEMVCIFTFVCSLLHEWALSEDTLMVMPKEEELKLRSKCFQKLAAVYEYCRGCAGGFFFAVLSIIITMYSTYINGKNHYAYLCRWTGPIESVTFQATAFALIVFYAYTWLTLCFVAYHEDENKPKEKVQ